MNDSMKAPIHIMTSCDENLLNRLSILLQSIADNLSGWPVHFFCSTAEFRKTDLNC